MSLLVPPSLKYARVERERRWLLRSVPGDLPVESTLEITDRYLVGTRLRLRTVVADDGTVVRKLGHKVRLGAGPHEVACTSLYLDDAEWDLLAGLPGCSLHKRRQRARLDGVVVAVDVLAGDCSGVVLAELDRGDGPDRELPTGLDPVAEVTGDEAFTGAALAAADRDEVRRAVAGYGVVLS